MTLGTTPVYNTVCQKATWSDSVPAWTKSSVQIRWWCQYLATCSRKAKRQIQPMISPNLYFPDERRLIVSSCLCDIKITILIVRYKSQWEICISNIKQGILESWWSIAWQLRHIWFLRPEHFSIMRLAICTIYCDEILTVFYISLVLWKDVVIYIHRPRFSWIYGKTIWNSSKSLLNILDIF